MLYSDIILVAHEKLEYLIQQPLVFIERFHSSLAEIYSGQSAGGPRYPDAEEKYLIPSSGRSSRMRTSKTINFGTLMDGMEKRKEAGKYISSIKQQMKGKR